MSVIVQMSRKGEQKWDILLSPGVVAASLAAIGGGDVGFVLFFFAEEVGDDRP